MDQQDKAKLIEWLQCGLTYNEVISIERIGYVGNGRFSEEVRRKWVFLWNWSAPRFSGPIGMRQDRVYDRMGKDFLNRRLARINRIIETLKKANHGSAKLQRLD